MKTDAIALLHMRLDFNTNGSIDFKCFKLQFVLPLHSSKLNNYIMLNTLFVRVICAHFFILWPLKKSGCVKYAFFLWRS
jgi:hypothetical protein